MGFYRFFGDFGLRDTFHERIASKPIEIDMDKLRMKFSALDVDFNGLSLNFFRLKETCHEGIKERCLCKSSYFSDVGQSIVKMVAE